MPDVREVFQMVKQQTQPDIDSWARQERRLRRAARNRKVGALAVVAALALGAAILVVSNMGGQRANVPASTGSAGATPRPTPDIHSLALGGYSPRLSPDGTMVAFLRDPEAPRIKHGAPFVLQVWVINVDGSGLRKVGQQPGCCISISGGLRWSKDGSSVVLIAGGRHRIDVATDG